MISILKYSEVDNNAIFSRVQSTINVEQIVADIINNVRTNGDRAVFEYCEKFDKAKLSSLLVTEQEIEDAVKKAQVKNGKPTVIVANTVKGKGVSFMENNVNWHGAAPNAELYETAVKDLAEIEKGLN